MSFASSARRARSALTGGARSRSIGRGSKRRPASATRSCAAESIGSSWRKRWRRPDTPGRRTIPARKLPCLPRQTKCTGAREPLLVLWFAPEYYYYADRPFAGRMVYMNGFYTSDTNQRLNIAALERDRPAVAIMEAGREATDLATHPAALAFLAREYHELGRLPALDGTAIRVFGRNDRLSTSRQADLGWPCYR